jgi:Zn ribbon nucleic-acid-binding protein
MTHMAETPFVFHPRMLITGPFQACPQCRQSGLGTLSISNNVHTRQCRNCSHTEEERLPPLAKKMIYLDQMVLSGIAKELDPAWRHKTRRRDEFWLEAFDRIDRLVKLQLIVCPHSPIHEIESAFAHHYESVLRRLYKHLASGVGLRFPHEVLWTQLAEAFEAWFAGREPDWNRIARTDVIHGDLDRWSPRLLLDVNMGYLAGEIEGRRESRDRSHEALQLLWEQWKSEGRIPFEDRFQTERCGLASAALQSFMTHVQRWREATTGTGVSADPMRLMHPGWPVRLVNWVLHQLEGRGVPDEDQLPLAADFLHSEQALSAPENHLGALLFAGLGHRAASGQRRVPSRGTRNDVKFLSAYLPYCDAMFIDNEFAQLLGEGPVASEVEKYPTRIFSTRSRLDFLAYLDTLEDDPTHVERVARTYGERWTEPYRPMLEHERKRCSPDTRWTTRGGARTDAGSPGR